MRARSCAVGLVLAISAVGCKGNGAREAPRTQEPAAPVAPAEPEAPPAPAALPDIDVGVIRPEQRADFFRVLNETFCYCGCPRTIASCLAAKADCSCVRCSERMAGFILDQYKSGLSTEEIELELLDGFTEGFNGPRRDIEISDRASKGSATAKQVWVEFADFRCGHCKAAFGPLAALVESNPDVRLVFFHFPLGTAVDTPSHFAAEAAEEARVQGKFWELAELMFRNQHALEPQNLVEYAEQAGLDVAKFKAALDKRIHRDRVLADKKVGQGLNIERTPAIFVNGRPLGLDRTLENMKLRSEMEAERGRCD